LKTAERSNSLTDDARCRCRSSGSAGGGSHRTRDRSAEDASYRGSPDAFPGRRGSGVSGSQRDHRDDSNPFHDAPLSVRSAARHKLLPTSKTIEQEPAASCEVMEKWAAGSLAAKHKPGGFVPALVADQD
jgi:hypothetical protein